MSDPQVHPVSTSRMVILPEKIWGRLASRAEDRGVSVEEIVTTALDSLIAPRTVEERIVDLVRAGYPDREVAHMTGELLHRVASVRRKAHLAPNRFGVRAA